MGRKRRPGAPRAPVEQEPGSGFGGLAAALSAEGLTPSAEPSTPTPPPPVPTRDGSLLRGKAVVRQERKGRGGKTVTVVDGAAITRHGDADALARTMRKALGTGARAEGKVIILKGDLRRAAARWLEDQGATVILGN